MDRRPSPMLAAIAGGLLGLALVGCGDATPVGPSGEISPSFSAHGERTEVNTGIAAVRAATARYHRLEVAEADGYVRISECVANPAGEGAMGFHYGRPDLLDDATVAVDEPEVLVYAPSRDGELRLVAVEWVVPLALAEDAPELLGHHFHANPVIGIWGLHAWVWHNNRSGLFADFNPRVSCDADEPA